MAAVRTLSPTYADARAAFLAAAATAEARRSEFPHGLKGPDGGDLAIDVAEFGPPDAESVLVVVSATHGVEGFAGSALQLRWVEECTADRPDGVRVVLIHALNPFGFAWIRRVNEDNVDLNRNFIDWTAGTPTNPDYVGLADVIVPASWSDEEQQRTLSVLLDYLDAHGFAQLQAIISGGQYEEPKGVFYGGTGPVWSHRWLRSWFTDHLRAARQVAILDLHTGLGDWGTAQLIGGEAGTALHERSSVWFGDVVPMGGEDSVSADLSGDWLAAAEAMLPRAEVAAVAIEFGTVDPVSVLQSLRADAWLHGYGDPAGPDAPAIQAQVRAAFADDDPAWLDAIWEPFETCVARAFARLGAA
jgi:hypothetical protein